MPDDVTLRQTEKNEVLGIIDFHGFDADEFLWREEDGRWLGGTALQSVLTHKRSRYYIAFGYFKTTISPGPTQRVESFEHSGDWEPRRKYCRSWLQELRKEVDAPDLWAAVGQERALAAAASSEETGNNPLTPQEQQMASESLNEIKVKLLSIEQFDERQAAIVDGQFKYLGEAVNRVGRKDLLMLTFGSLVTIIVALSLTQEQGNTILKLAGVLLHQLWDGVNVLGQ